MKRLTETPTKANESGKWPTPTKEQAMAKAQRYERLGYNQPEGSPQREGYLQLAAQWRTKATQPSLRRNAAHAVTSGNNKEQAMETAKIKITWVEQPNYDLASEPIEVGVDGNRLLAEVKYEYDRENDRNTWVFSLIVENKDGKEIDRVSGWRLVGSNNAKARWARLETAKRKAEAALLAEIANQGIYNPEDVATPQEANQTATTPIETQPETPNVVIPLETAQALALFLSATKFSTRNATKELKAAILAATENETAYTKAWATLPKL